MIYFLTAFKISKSFFNYSVNRMQKMAAISHLTKHNHDKRSSCCYPKNALPRDLDEKP